MSIEGIRIGYFFCQECIYKGMLEIGTRAGASPYKTSLSTPSRAFTAYYSTGTAQQVFEWGAKEECVKENFGGGGGGACLWISIQFL